MVLKFILITLLIVFIIVKIGGMIFRTMFWMLGARAGQRNPSRHSQQRPRSKHTKSFSGDIEIEYVPEDGRKRQKSEFNGGEYVDFEEVK